MPDGIDLKELRKLNRDLREFRPDKALKKSLKLAGELIAQRRGVIADKRHRPAAETLGHA